MDILKIIKEKALLKKNKILMVEGEDERVIEASVMAVKEGVCFPLLLGNESVIKKIAEEKGLTIDGISIIDYKDSPRIDEYAAKLAEIRKHKGLSVEKAKELLANPNYFGALLLKLGEVDGAVGGCKYSSADWMRPVFQVIGKKDGVELISAICFVIMKERVIFFADTDFNIKPDSGQIAQIAINAAGFVKNLGITPKVALLSYSTKGSGEHPSLSLIRDALETVKEKDPSLIIDGEIQLDAATDQGAAQKKCPDSILKGDANVLVFPDITVGNVLIHAISKWTNYQFFGSFPIGLAKPCMNGGRSFDVKEIYDVITSCAMECNF